MRAIHMAGSVPDGRSITSGWQTVKARMDIGTPAVSRHLCLVLDAFKPSSYREKRIRDLRRRPRLNT